MVKLSLDKAHTVFARSIDRNGTSNETPSDYKLILRDSITTADDHYAKVSLISAKIPSTFYQIDQNNRTLTLRVNSNDFSVIKNHPAVPAKDYARQIDVSIAVGNYNVDELLQEVKTKLNAKCTELHAITKFRTYMRSADVASAEYKADLADSGVAGNNGGLAYIEVCPVFETEYNKQLNKMRMYRTDAGGKMVMGKFDLLTSGPKLTQCLGLTHITSQMQKQLGALESTATEPSVHYRESALTEYYGFPILTKTVSTKYGHSVYSPACINMYHNDTVYVRTSLPSNGYETLSGTNTNVMCVIPMTAGQNAENFYSPSIATSTNIGNIIVSELNIRLTDANGITIDFNSCENELTFVFECFEKGTALHKPPSNPDYRELNMMSTFTNMHKPVLSRHSTSSGSRVSKHSSTQPTQLRTQTAPERPS